MRPRAVLVGPPGSGKTTVGSALAAAWAVSFRDTDADIETIAGKPIPDIFVDDGEEHFRALEVQAVRTALAEHGGVLSLGGGAILATQIRELLTDHPVIFLTVELGEAVKRVGLDQGRPLLAVNPRATLRYLMEQRRPLYEEVATHTVDTTGRGAEEIVAEITKLLTMAASRGVAAAPRPLDPSEHRADISQPQSSAATRIEVGGEQPYEIIIGDHITGCLPGLVAGAARAAVIFTASVKHDASHVVHELIDAGLIVTPIEVPDAEAAKTLEVAGRCWETLATGGLTRTDVIVGVGGGALTDLAGFVAAGWLRGVRWVPVATSVNGMVDAAIGGKTGVNIAAGKNLVGAFHPPAGVLCELSALRTLPAAHVNAGMAEVVKCGFIADPVILDLIGHEGVLPELIERSVRVKAGVVSQDLRESGLREILNYGHTLAHAIEKVENYRWSHGHAVSVGLVYAAILGRLTGRPDFVDQTRKPLASLGLPVSYDGPWAQLRAAMAVDKKARGSSLRFVLLDGLAQPVTVAMDDERLLVRAYEDLRV